MALWFQFVGAPLRWACERGLNRRCFIFVQFLLYFILFLFKPNPPAVTAGRTHTPVSQNQTSARPQPVMQRTNSASTRRRQACRQKKHFFIFIYFIILLTRRGRGRAGGSDATRAGSDVGRAEGSDVAGPASQRASERGERPTWISAKRGSLAEIERKREFGRPCLSLIFHPNTTDLA